MEINYEQMLETVAKRKEEQTKKSLSDLEAMAKEQKEFDESMRKLGEACAKKQDAERERLMHEEIEKAKAEAEARVREKYRKKYGLKDFTATSIDKSFMELQKSVGEQIEEKRMLYGIDIS